MDATGWDERYAASGLVWSSGPNRTVADEVGGLTAGTALDLGAGEGRNALWLAEQGWTVTAVDFSAVGLDKARAIARQRRLQLTTAVADVTRYHPKQTYDLLRASARQRPPFHRCHGDDHGVRRVADSDGGVAEDLAAA